MMNVIVSIFLLLHGLVHLLYLGQSRRLFELQPEMVWPDGAWTFSLIGRDAAARMVASVSLVIATIGFAAGAAGTLLGQDWSRPVITGAALWSSATFLLFWDGKIHQLDDQGGVGLLINLMILFFWWVWPVW